MKGIVALLASRRRRPWPGHLTEEERRERLFYFFRVGLLGLTADGWFCAPTGNVRFEALAELLNRAEARRRAEVE